MPDDDAASARPALFPISPEQIETLAAVAANTDQPALAYILCTVANAMYEGHEDELAADVSQYNGRRTEESGS